MDYAKFDDLAAEIAHFGKHRNSVLVRAAIALDDIFMDVLVDDGFLARHCAREAEAIVGDGNPDLPIQGDPREFRVRIVGIEYGVDQAEAAADAVRMAKL